MTGSRTSTQYLVAASIDGFIADENNDLSWLLQLDQAQTEAAAADGGDGNPYDRFVQDVGAIAMGATTYEWILEHDSGPWPYAQPTWVFTHRDLPRTEGADVVFTSADVPTVHTAMVAAAAGKNVWLVGGGDLVGQFLDHDLLDEIWLSVTPVILGRGAPLLPRRRTEPMRLVSVDPAPNGTFVHLRYSLR